MGGGWGKQGNGIPLSERRVTAAVPKDVDTCPARHCWVSDPVDGAGVPRPGLLIEWRQAGGRWEGRVAYAVSLRAGEWAVVEEWLPAALLRPL